MHFRPTHNFFRCLAILISFHLLLVSCGKKEPALIKRTQFLMGTLVEVTVRTPDAALAQKAIDLAFNEISRLEQLMSTHLPNSEVSKINKSAGTDEPVPVSPEIMESVRRGIHWAEFTQGAIDITIGPATALWNFEDETPSPPESGGLREAIKLINYKDISVGEKTLRLSRKGMSLHLGAMGKGYAVDRAVAVLKSSGIKNGLVNAGGDLMAFGTRDGTQDWHIGLQHPRKPEAMIASLNLSGRAVATSGDYQRYFIQDGTRYHHILNPQNGQPVRSTISATVIASSVTDADALATAVFVLGSDRGIALINSLDGVEGMVLPKSGIPNFSAGFRSLPGFSFKGFDPR